MFSTSVRANPLERVCPLPGDDLIPRPIATLTHAITIHRPRKEVWPWLAQMGAGTRAGWYSYDWLDNSGQPSANRIVPALQNVGVGTLLPAQPGATDGFHVLALEVEHFLVIGWRPAAGTPPIMSWAFVLHDLADGSTRLVVRARGSRDYPFYGMPAWIGMPWIRAVHFVMERKQLVGIRNRVHSHAPAVAQSEAA